MNLNIVWDKNGDIENYKNIHVSGNDYLEAIRAIPDSGCRSIHVSEDVYLLPYRQVLDVITLCALKLRIGGRISISSINFELIATNYINGQLTEEDLSRFLLKINSVIDYSTLTRIMSNNKIMLQGVDASEYYQILHGSR